MIKQFIFSIVRNFRKDIYQNSGMKKLITPDNFNNRETKYATSTLNRKQIEKRTEIVFDYLKCEKPYLNPDFNLQMMSDDLNISRQQLSMAINFDRQKNFYKLINTFRVEEVKEKLIDSDYKHFTILGIALECGFNSKASFNRIFKEETGLTPSEYKKQFNL